MQKPEFVDLLQKQPSSHEVSTTKLAEKPIRKVKVKALRGSSYVISQEECDVVGEGSFGKVMRAYDMHNRDEDLVAKVIPLDDKSKLESLQIELRVLEKLPFHVNLVNYKKIKISSKHRQYFIMDYCNGGTLSHYLKRQRSISESEIIEFLQQFCRGYRVLYTEGIIHRDIKPDNILLHNKVFKIADFGLAKIVDRLQTNNISTRGTPLYIAPELVRKEAASAKVDMWSLGIILYRMMYNSAYPFLDPSVKYTVTSALRDIIHKKLDLPKAPARSIELKSLLMRMLEKSDATRISWEEFFQHEFVKASLDAECIAAEEYSEGDPIPAYMRKDMMSSNLMKNSRFLTKIEVIRQSKIQMKRISKKKDEPIEELPIDERKEDNSDAETYAISSKALEAIMRESKRRRSAGEAVNKIEDILLSYREKVLFLDMLALRVIIMAKRFARVIEDEVSGKIYCLMSQKVSLLLIKTALIFNTQLSEFRRDFFEHEITNEQWSDFLMSDNNIILTELLRQDKVSLLQFIDEELIDCERQEQSTSHGNDIRSYYTRISNLSMEDLLNEMNDTFRKFLKEFSGYYEQCGGELKLGMLILFTYLYEAYSINAEENCVFAKFTTFYDYWAYFELIERDSDETALYTELVAKTALL